MIEYFSQLLPPPGAWSDEEYVDYRTGTDLVVEVVSPVDLD